MLKFTGSSPSLAAVGVWVAVGIGFNSWLISGSEFTDDCSHPYINTIVIINNTPTVLEKNIRIFIASFYFFDLYPYNTSGLEMKFQKKILTYTLELSNFYIE